MSFTLNLTHNMQIDSSPEPLRSVADLLATDVSALAQEISAQLSAQLCPTCLAHKKVSAVVNGVQGAEVNCPSCSGAGWLNGYNPLTCQDLSITTTFEIAPDVSDFVSVADLLNRSDVTAAQEIGASLLMLVCPTCLGHKQVSATVRGVTGAEIDCPVCSATGWANGASPLVES